MDRPEHIGRKYEIRRLVLADGLCPAGDFLASLQPEDKRKVRILFEMLGDLDHIANAEKYAEIDGTGGIFVLMPRRQVAIFGFRHARTVHLLFGTTVEGRRYTNKDVKRAVEYREWYLKQQGETT